MYVQSRSVFGSILFICARRFTMGSSSGCLIRKRFEPNLFVALLFFSLSLFFLSHTLFALSTLVLQLFS